MALNKILGSARSLLLNLVFVLLWNILFYVLFGFLDPIGPISFTGHIGSVLERNKTIAQRKHLKMAQEPEVTLYLTSLPSLELK